MANFNCDGVKQYALSEGTDMKMMDMDHHNTNATAADLQTPFTNPVLTMTHIVCVILHTSIKASGHPIFPTQTK